MSKHGGITYKNARKSGKSWIYITIALVVAAVLLGGVSVFVLLQKNDFNIKKTLGMRTADEATTLAAPETGSVPAAAVVTASKDTFRYLFLCGDTDSGFAFLAEISACISKNTITVEPVSPDERLTYNGSNMSVAQLFAEYPYDLVRCYYENSTEVFDKYLRITTANFKKLMAELGAINITLTQDLPYVVDGITYTFRKGEQSLTSDLLLKYMTATGTGKTLLGYQAEALQRLLETHFTAANFADGEAFFSMFISYFTSDINIYDYRNAAGAISAFAAAKPVVISSYLPDGEDAP